MTCEKVLIINQGRMVAFDEIRNLAHALGQADQTLARGDLHQAHRRRLTPQGSTTRMRNALAIARKELCIYFTTPWAYVVFTAMLGISSFFFVSLLATSRRCRGSPGSTAGHGCRRSTGSSRT